MVYRIGVWGYVETHPIKENIPEYGFLQIQDGWPDQLPHIADNGSADQGYSLSQKTVQKDHLLRPTSCDGAVLSIEQSLSHLLSQKINSPIKVDPLFIQRSTNRDRSQYSTSETIPLLKSALKTKEAPASSNSPSRTSSSSKTVRFCPNRLVIYFKTSRIPQDDSSDWSNLNDEEAPRTAGRKPGFKV